MYMYTDTYNEDFWVILCVVYGPREFSTNWCNYTMVSIIAFYNLITGDVVMGARREWDEEI